MKKAWNLTKFVLAVFAPAAIFFAFSEFFKLNPEPYITFLSVLGILFGGVILQTHLGPTHVWAIASKSVRDKIVLTVNLILMLFFLSLPKYLEITLWWFVLLSCFLGLLLAFLCVRLFGSKAMYAALLEPNKKTAADV